MGSEFSNLMSAFWSTIMEKLNENRDKKEVIKDTIKEICRYFNFGCSFVYICNSEGVASLFATYHAYLDYEHLTPSFHVKNLFGEELYEQFQRGRFVSFDRLTDMTPLDMVCQEQFRAKSMILVPLVNQRGELIACVGMADRRGECREGEQDITFAYYILVVLGNYLQIYLTETASVRFMDTLNRVLNNTGIEVYVIDYDTDEILYGNAMFLKRFGEDVIGEKCFQILFSERMEPCEFCPKDRVVTREHEPLESCTWTLQMNDGSYRKFISNAFYWVDGRLAQSVSSFDITETVKNEEKIRYYAKHDALTGLGNRHKLLLDCDDRIAQAKKEGKTSYLIFADLDKFKLVNDQYGHGVGDALLEAVGDFFGTNPDTKDITYRFAGDEFVILAYDKTEDEIKQMIENIQKRFHAGWHVAGCKITCGMSLGYTRYDGDERTTSDLLHYADMKMYEMKKAEYQ